ncbi:MAG: LacI family DNA-binding transcriptional regulator [bacterium]|nr:LacI family DNA-binding transcriptional regulator [bacterium]MDD3805819.1 LacI family DNA-binding transcriptional regulator [bacterium]MDD4152154.1 LacI family DNA-binding transcriptional regulator [bacterium]MDD4557313.1 LacI family DNA-binding transcriptional regulator [bacterium]
MFDIELSNGTPIYMQIREHLKKEISSGILAGGTRLPTDHEVCQRLGVSVATVKQAYSELIKEGYLERYPGRGTFVAQDMVPANRPFSDSKNIGIVFHNIFSVTDPSIARTVEGIAEAAQAYGYEIHVFTTNGRKIFDGSAILRENIFKRHLAGLIFLSPMEESDIRELQRLNCPLAVVDDVYLNMKVPAVLFNDEETTYFATRELIRKGHQKAALIVSQRLPLDLRIERGRERMWEGYRRAIKEAKLDFLEMVTKYVRDNDKRIADIVADKHAVLQEATALVIAGDWLAQEVYDYLCREGRAIGKDVDLYILTGVSVNIPGAEAIYLPLKLQGKRVFKMLMDQINSTDFKCKEILPVEFDVPVC